MRLAEPLDAAYARREIGKQLTALQRLEARADGKVRIATSIDDKDRWTRSGSFAIVLHMEGADGIDADLLELENMYRWGLRSLGPVWSRTQYFRSWRSICVAPLAQYRPRADPCGKRPDQGMQQTPSDDRHAASQRAGLLGCSEIEFGPASGDPYVRTCDLPFDKEPD